MLHDAIETPPSWQPARLEGLLYDTFGTVSPGPQHPLEGRVRRGPRKAWVADRC